MPKAILSNKIYLDVTPEVSKKLIYNLTYKIRKNIPGVKQHFVQFDIIKNYKVLPKNIMAIPIGRTDLIPEGYEIIDKRTINELPFPDPKFPLRGSQIDVYNEVDGTCFINAMVGWGKTFTALHIARKLGQKTLIVCHNTMLRDQWKEEVEKLFEMPVGVIGSGEFDIDHSIVVGNIQTLTKLVPQICKEFGTVIVDEAHHCPASTFTSFIDGMYARYKIGLSGTMQRKDGRQILFRDFFGSKLFQPPQENTLTPVVQVIRTGIALSPGETWAKKINNLLYDEDYQHFIAATAKLQIDKGHKVLIVADRVEFLQQVGELIGEQCVCITGGTTYDERTELKRQIEDGEKSCIAGSRQIFAEGISVNILSCVILAVPIANDGLLEQIIGRIMRQHKDKITPPLVLDMQFSGPGDRKQNKDRIAFYMRKGWTILGL
jgi:superfamily II DNA or RNA helicase